MKEEQIREIVKNELSTLLKNKEIPMDFRNDLFNSIILNTDGYKFSHYKQYPISASYMNSYIESRGGRWNQIIFYGLQMFIKEYLLKPITKEQIEYAKYWVETYMPDIKFNEFMWNHILQKYGGKLPLKIEAVPEGTIMPTNQVLVQVRNTDDCCGSLTSYIETALLRAIWYPVAVATNSFMCKQIIKHYLEITGTPDTIEFRLHDFGARGVSSFESAGIGGSAHLLNFKGTDTTQGIYFAQKYYNAKEFPGFSIPAAEHSTITSWRDEERAYSNMVTQFGNSTYAVVIDSYDTFNAIDNIWSKFKDVLKNKKGCVVLRPDSGNPVAMATNCLEKMMYHFGYTVNAKGYRVLPDYIRMIYGDGIDEQSIGDILRACTMQKISADNISFGMGGALLQHLNRDTLRFAMKCSAVSDDGSNWKDVYKNPATDPNKKSKPGVLALIQHSNGIYETIPVKDWNTVKYPNKLRTVFENGDLLIDETFEEIRSRIIKN